MLKPAALVFEIQQAGGPYSWEYRHGADWRHPLGPKSSIEGKGKHPVVQVAWEDAVAYAEWAGKSLPTEAQWEYAARGGENHEYIWGEELVPDGIYMANTWQGNFPYENDATDMFSHTAPVKTYEPNKFGLYDMGGNVWEWCSDWYRPDAYKTSASSNPTGPIDSYDPMEPGLPKRVTRGGSFLCSQNVCRGYRPSSRMKTTPDTGLIHTGFRCVRKRP
jgi:formylglycine-generating enzyme required for sulfatase activity